MDCFTVIDPIYRFANDILIDNIAKEIIQTPEFIRLRGIKQAGITAFFTKRSYDRAEHSVGVYLLLKYLGANIEQCIGGLLHDIYHTNFSHTTDELFCGESQDSFHEKNKFIFFERCCKNITKILNKNFSTRDTKYFLDGENLLITKNKSFGADVLDYFIRDGYYEGVITIEWINDLLTKIGISNGRIILDDLTMAKDFFNKTIYINDNIYMSPFSRGQYKIFVNVLKVALETNIIMFDMIVYGYNTDQEIYERIKKYGNTYIQELLNVLETTTDYSYCECREKNLKKTQTKISRKLRFLNPPCNKVTSSHESPVPVSEIDTDVSKILMEKREQYSRQEDLFVGNDSVVCSQL